MHPFSMSFLMNPETPHQPKRYPRPGARAQNDFETLKETEGFKQGGQRPLQTPETNKKVKGYRRVIQQRIWEVHNTI